MASLPDIDALPDDLSALWAMFAGLQAELAADRVGRAKWEAKARTQEAELAATRLGMIEQRYEIDTLKARLARLLQQAFRRSAERLARQIGQLEFVLEDVDATLGETNAPRCAGAPRHGRYSGVRGRYHRPRAGSGAGEGPHRTPLGQPAG